MSNNLHKGDSVSWNTSNGKTHGKVVKKLEKDAKIKGHHVSASKDDPQYEVESDKTGAHAAHKPESLDKE